MSSDSETVPTGKAIAEGIRKEDLHQVKGTPFVDWRPQTDETQLIRFMMGPLTDLAAKIDNRLSQIESKMHALTQRIAVLEENQRVADVLKAKHRKKKA